MKRRWRTLVHMSLYQLRDLYRNKIAFFFNLIFPLILVLLFGTLFQGSGAEVETMQGVRQPSVFDYLMPGQMTVMLLSAGLFTVAISVASQRQSGAMRHLFSTPLPVGVWATARVGANFLMAMLQAVILVSFAALVYGVAPPANIVGTFVTITVSMLCALGLGLLIGTLAKGEEAALGIAMPLYMGLLFLGNAAMPLDEAPAVIQRMLPYVPTYHMTEALRAVMRHGLPLATVSSELAILGALATVTFAVALWRIRRQYVAV